MNGIKIGSVVIKPKTDFEIQKALKQKRN